MEVITTDSAPYYSQVTNLEGDNYILEFRWNARDSTWYLNISQSDSTLLAAGIRLVCNWPLLDSYADKNLPLGDLVVGSSTGDNSPPGLTDLLPGARCALYYFTSDELAGYISSL